MKYLLIPIITLASIVHSADLETSNDLAHFSIYGVDSKKSEANSGKSSNGMGIYYDTEAIKIKIENTADSIKLGGVFKYNYTDNWIIKAGLTYLNEKIYAYDYSTARVNQYGYALGLGYKISDSFYVEIAGNRTDLQGESIGTWYKINDETTQRLYGELVKRFNGNYGIIDTSINVGKTYHEFADNETFVGGGINYYPIPSSKVSLFHNNEENNKYTSYSINYKAIELSYVDAKDSAHYLTVGFKLECINIFNPSTCKIPTNIIPDISENDKFEQITFSSGMEIQSGEENPIVFQCLKVETTAMFQGFDWYANGCVNHNSELMDYNYVYDGQDMFFGQTGNPVGFQDFDWYSN